MQMRWWFQMEDKTCIFLGKTRESEEIRPNMSNNKGLDSFFLSIYSTQLIVQMELFYDASGSEFIFFRLIKSYLSVSVEACLLAVACPNVHPPIYYMLVSYKPHADRQRYAYYCIHFTYFSSVLSLSTAQHMKQNGNALCIHATSLPAALCGHYTNREWEIENRIEIRQECNMDDRMDGFVNVPVNAAWLV